MPYKRNIGIPEGTWSDGNTLKDAEHENQYKATLEKLGIHVLGCKGRKIYESLWQKKADDIKSGAGQYFTPRTLIKAMVACVRPEPDKMIADPFCVSSGFFLAC